MAGAKQFDLDQALDAAMRVFWEKGFEGTSYTHLMAATGLNKSSLYNAYGDKEALYKHCLERYAEIFGTRLCDRLNDPDIEAAIAGFLEELVSRFQCSDAPGGCMSTFAAFEIGCRHKSLGERIRHQFETIETAMRVRCERAVVDGQLPADTDVAAVASFLQVMTRGLAAVHLGYGDVAAVERATRAMMQILKAPPLLNS